MWRAARSAAVVAALAGLALLLALLLPGIAPESGSPVPAEPSASPAGTRPGQALRGPAEMASEPAGAAPSHRLEPSEFPPGSPEGAPSELAGTGSYGPPTETEPEEPGPVELEATPWGSGETSRSGNWVLDPEIHQQILDELPERDEVPYLSVRIFKLATQTLQYFPREDRAVRAEARRRVSELRRRMAERKRETRGDLAALEALRSDLVRIDRDVEVWRERVLQGEPVLPEFEL